MALGQILSHSLARNEYPAAPARRSYGSHLPVSHSQVSNSPVTRSPGSHSRVSVSKQLNRLLSAAVVSPCFESLLLTDPVTALAAGYNGESFALTPVEYAAVTSLRASSIQDFAAQLLRMVQHSTGDSAVYPSEVKAPRRQAKVAMR